MTELTFEDFENLAVTVKENKTTVLISEMHLAAFAVEHDQVYRNEDPPPRLARWLAHQWGKSTVHGVNVLARMAEVFSDDDILPNVPLSLYNAVMETDNPVYALRLATDAEFRREVLGEEFAKTDKKGIWSSRDVRDFYDKVKGRHLSSTRFEGEVEVTEWNLITGGFAVVGLPISGEPPPRARVTVCEVL